MGRSGYRPHRLPPRFRQCARAGVNGVLAEQLFDAQELIVLRQTIGAAEEPVFAKPKASASSHCRILPAELSRPKG